MDIKDIKDLIITIDNTDIETVEIEKNDIKIMITKGNFHGDSIQTTKGSVEKGIIKEEVIEAIEEIDTVEEDLFIVKSPVVGAFYESPNPEEEAFVKVGDKVEKGDTLCIIEAMKIMNEIESEVSGEIVEILVKNEDIVEYGQALMKVRR